MCTKVVFQEQCCTARAMLYCSIIDLAALAASIRFSWRTSIWDELTDEKLFSPNHLTRTLFCTGNQCCKLLGTSFKLHIWAGYQILACLAQIMSPWHHTSPHFCSSSSFDSSESLVWPWSSSSSNWASSSLLESVFSIIHHIKVFNLFWHNDVCFINLFQCFAIITKSIIWTLGAS